MDAGAIQILHMVNACPIYMQHFFDGDLLLYLECIRKTGSWKKADEDRVIEWRTEVYFRYGFHAFCFEDNLLLYLANLFYLLSPET